MVLDIESSGRQSTAAFLNDMHEENKDFLANGFHVSRVEESTYNDIDDDDGNYLLLRNSKKLIIFGFILCVIRIVCVKRSIYRGTCIMLFIL